MKRRATLVDTYLNEVIDYGGIPSTRGAAIIDMQSRGIPQDSIDRWFQGYEYGQRLRERKLLSQPPAILQIEPVRKRQRKLLPDPLPRNIAGLSHTTKE